MFIYRRTEPVEEFDGLTALPDRLVGTLHPHTTRWALQAILALADAAAAGWRGNMRQTCRRSASRSPRSPRPRTYDHQ